MKLSSKMVRRLSEKEDSIQLDTDRSDAKQLMNIQHFDSTHGKDIHLNVPAPAPDSPRNQNHSTRDKPSANNPLLQNQLYHHSPYSTIRNHSKGETLTSLRTTNSKTKTFTGTTTSKFATDRKTHPGTTNPRRKSFHPDLQRSSEQTIQHRETPYMTKK